MNQDLAMLSPGLRIKQKRGRKTYEALVATGFKLLKRREFESITIAELARAAGYSVGAFYSRFHSKDEFFDALLAHHTAERSRTRARLLKTAPIDTLISVLIDDLVTTYWKRRRFWRAALMRSFRDPDFWEPIRRLGHEFADLLIARMEAHAKRTLTDAERMNVRFAFQIALGTINNTIINRPGPTFMGQAIFVENLSRAFRLVSDYDHLMGTGREQSQEAGDERKPPSRRSADETSRREKALSAEVVDRG